MHDGGDFVLENLSKSFVQQVRQQDLIARWGGEEFLFLLPNTRVDDAFTLAEKIRKNVEKTIIDYNNNPIDLTLSIGVVEVSSNSNIDQAINDADHLLYLAKNKGRNQTISTNMI
jgi:diguanylate cyclase (GGDEF)-like protein